MDVSAYPVNWFELGGAAKLQGCILVLPLPNSASVTKIRFQAFTVAQKELLYWAILFIYLWKVQKFSTQPFLTYTILSVFGLLKYI